MKEDLLKLINRKEEMEIELGVYSKVDDSRKFTAWKEELICELNEIYKRTKKESKIGEEFEILSLLREHFDGYNDIIDFNKLKGRLNFIKNNIDNFYPEEKDKKISFEMDLSSNKENANGKKDFNLKSKIFISHSNQDNVYINPFVELLENIGLTKEHIIYTSISEYGIPLDEDIYDYLKKQFQNYKLHMFFMLSDNYYDSPACLNEMGAAWVLQNKYTTILLPNFEYKKIEGAVNPRQIGLKFDEDLINVKAKLRIIKNNLIQEFNLSSVSEDYWDRKCEDFINKINNKINELQ